MSAGLAISCNGSRIPRYPCRGASPLGHVCYHRHDLQMSDRAAIYNDVHDRYISSSTAFSTVSKKNSSQTDKVNRGDRAQVALIIFV